MTGVVLAGGRSRRMGKDKCFLQWRGQALIEHSIDVLKTFTSRIVISANETGYNDFGYEVINDLFPGTGPLGGIATVMTECDDDVFAFLPCDMPFVVPELFEFLLSFKGENQAVVPVFDGNVEPLVLIADKTVLTPAKEMLELKKFKILDFLNSVKTAFVNIEPSLNFYSPVLFANINTPEDYNALQG